MPTMLDLSFSTPAGRWARLGPYYAMFPIPFVSEVIRLFAKPRQTVVDPFCGRGAVPFIAMASGVRAIAADLNPVAWVYSKAKTDPHPRPDEVKTRIGQIREAVSPSDYLPEHEFQKLAFCTDALAFINASRRELDWRKCRLDWTVAAFLLQYLHDKRERGLSNQMRHSRAMSPAYCIRWWHSKGYDQPPEIETHSFLQSRVEWRYAKGIVEMEKTPRPSIGLGSAHDTLPESDLPADLVFTSPPYCNVTNYRSDNWLRLWALGEGPSLPDWNPELKFADPQKYSAMLSSCFQSTLERSSPQAVWYVRSDARQQTRQIITRTLDGLLPFHQRYESPAPYKSATQTALYGDGAAKPGEVDLLYMPRGKRRRGFTRNFVKHGAIVG